MNKKNLSFVYSNLQFSLKKKVQQKNANIKQAKGNMQFVRLKIFKVL